MKTKSGKTLDLKSAKEIAAGGEGKILEHPLDKKKVVKVYHTPRKPEFANHLNNLTHLNKDVFVRPQEIYFDARGQVAGFDMDYVDFNNYWLFNNLFNKGFCTSNSITQDFKYNALALLKGNLEELHKNDIVIGDLNMYNIFISKKGKILFVDVDSYQTKDQPHSGVLLDEIRDWTTLSINKETDTWAYDILAFWATTYCHPFKWVVPGNKETLQQRVLANKSYLSSIQGIKVPALYEPPKGDVEKQFRDIFGGRRYFVDFNLAHAPVSIQVKQQVTSTALEIREILNTVTHVYSCGESITARKADGTWVFIETKTPKVTRQVTQTRDEIVFPCKGANPAYVIGSSLFIGAKGRYNFVQPIYYYNNGNLVVFDYATDTQWNFNLNNQKFGVDFSSTVVFTKSIIVRDSPIQNFGAKKYLNIPNGNKYSLVEVNKDTQNAIYVDGHTALEIKTKTKVIYSFGGIDLDYLPHFAVKNNFIFVPENGFINVYKEGSVISTMDCSMCTRDSKLYNTDSGIMLLENNTLYLLNTK